jgi:uncharacterized protein (TIGR02147 family)
MQKQANEPYFKVKLRDELSLRQRKNPQYSLRAFARNLGLQPAVLSDILNDKRKLPAKSAKAVCEKLLLSPVETARFVNSVKPSTVASGKTVSSDLDFKLIEANEAGFKVIAEWEHYAILDLIKIRGFKSDTEWMARRLGSTKLRMATVVSNLNSAGLISIDKKGNIKALQDSVTTTTDVASTALKISHKEALELGIKKLEEVALHERDFSSITLALDLTKMSDLKKEIREFRHHLLKKYGGTEKANSVYQMCVQLYPLTDTSTLKTNHTGVDNEKK